MVIILGLVGKENDHTLCSFIGLHIFIVLCFLMLIRGEPNMLWIYILCWFIAQNFKENELRSEFKIHTYIKNVFIFSDAF